MGGCLTYIVASFPALPSFPSTESWVGAGHKTITSLTTDIIFLCQLAQARPHNVLHFLVICCRKPSLQNIFREIKFRSLMRLGKFFNNENFLIYGIPSVNYNTAISRKILLCSYLSTGLGPELCSLTGQTHFTKREGEGSGELGVSHWNASS